MKLHTLERLRDGFASPLPLREARKLWKQTRLEVGLKATAPRLLTHPSGNAKLAKGAQYGLCLLPHRLSGNNVCAYSTPECRKLCINLSGRGRMPYVQEGRSVRTKFLFKHPDAFAAILAGEIGRLPKGANLRLNMFSDLLWEQIAPQLFTLRPDIQFYDYSKYPAGSRVLPSNYHLTYSASERWTDGEIADAVKSGDNVTVVLNLRRSEVMPTFWKGLPVVDGDKNDARYDDPIGVVVGLRAKGKAVRSDSKFVRQPA